MEEVQRFEQPSWEFISIDIFRKDVWLLRYTVVILQISCTASFCTLLRYVKQGSIIMHFTTYCFFTMVVILSNSDDLFSQDMPCFQCAICSILRCFCIYILVLKPNVIIRFAFIQYKDSKIMCIMQTEMTFLNCVIDM